MIREPSEPIHTPKLTVEPSAIEKQLITFANGEPRSNADRAAKLLVRQAVDISRYQRSIMQIGEQNDHHQRLTQCTAYFAQARVLRIIDETAVNAVSINSELDRYEWNSAKATYRPSVECVDGTSIVVFNGTEYFNYERITATEY